MNINWQDKIDNPDERQVFSALANKEWDFRTVDGIAKETGQSPSEITNIIEKYPHLIRLSPVPDKQGRQLFTLASKPISARERLASVRMFISKSIR